MADCFGTIRGLWDKKEVPDDVIHNLIDDLNEVKSRLMKDGKMDEFPSRIQQRLKEIKELTASQQKERALNIQRKNELSQRIGQFDNKTEGVLSTLGGSNVLLKGAKYSAEAIARSQKGKLMNMALMGLERDGLLQIAKSGTLDREIIAAKFSLERGETPTIPITEEAWKIAKVYHSVTKEILESKRAAGVSIGEIQGYVKQTHDSMKIQKAGFPTWLSDILPKLDIEKTFGDRDPMGKESQIMMKEIYDSIVDGKHGFIPNSPVADDLVTVFKTSRLGDKLKRNRTFHFKDGQSFYDYNSSYGRKSLFNTMMGDINNSSNQVGLISTFGTDPQKTIEALIKQNGLSENDAKTVRNVYKNVQGYSNLGGDSLKAKIGAGLRAQQAMSKLGMATLSSLGDWASSAAILHSNFGTGYLGNMGKLMEHYLKSVPSEARNTWSEKLGLYLEDMVNHIHANNEAGATGPGMISEMQRLSFKASGLELHTAASVLAESRMLATQLAEISSKSWDNLSPRVQANLGLYNIDRTDWALLKMSTEDIHGYQAMTPEAVEALDPQYFSDLRDVKYEGKKFKPTPEQMQRELSTKLRTFITDNASLGVPQPGSRVKAFILGDTDQASWEGQLRRFVGQFKSFPLTVHQVFSRVALANPERTSQSAFDAIFKGQGDVKGMVGFMLTSTLMGYLAIQAKNVIKGQSVNLNPGLDDTKDYFRQGGALGLYGDFLFGDYKNAYNSPGMLKFAKNVAGPVLSEGFDVAQLWTDAMDSRSNSHGRHVQPKQVEKQAITMMQRNTPFGNMFWSKYVLDKYIWDQMKEAADPGYDLRKQNRLQQKTNWQFKGP